MNNRTPRINVEAMALCALFAALSAAGAFINIPIGPVPFTLQVLFTNLAGLLLGKKRGLISVGLYILIGLTGVPVFTGGGGPAYVLAPTFGYLVGMALGAYASGAISERGGGSMKSYLLAGAAFLAFVYTLGAVYYYIITKFYLGNEVTAKTLLIYCCLIFIPWDAATCVLGAVITKRLRPLVSAD